MSFESLYLDCSAEGRARSSLLFAHQDSVMCSTSQGSKHFLWLLLLSLPPSEMKTRASFEITGVHSPSTLLHRDNLSHLRLTGGKGERSIKESAGR